MAINSFAFAYSCVVCTLGVIILPSEAVRLFREQHAMMLGVMLGCTGVTQLISPAIGYLSDRSTSRYGRRRPLMVMGAIISCAGNVAMLFAREYQLRGMFLAALTTAIAGLNISYACFTALLPDLVPAAHIGRASGTMATMSMLGALLGFSLFGFMLSTVHAYAIYCCVVSVTVGLTCLVAHEKPHSERTPYSCSELLSSYSIDHVRHDAASDVFLELLSGRELVPLASCSGALQIEPTAIPAHAHWHMLARRWLTPTSFGCSSRAPSTIWVCRCKLLCSLCSATSRKLTTPPTGPHSFP